MPNPTQVVQNESDKDSQVLRERIAFLGAHPFASQVVQSPWNTVVDVPSLHREVKDLIRTLIDGCGQPGAIRCLTMAAPAGYGKTHLLSWTRQLLDERNDSVFVYVLPYIPGTPGGVTLEQHVMRATVDALWLRSRRQHDGFEQAVRNRLVSCYDHIVETGSTQDIKLILKAGTFWSRLFRRSRLKLNNLGVQDQIAAIQRALSRRAFLERAFAEFNQQHPPGVDGVRADWDAFVAACLLACGDTRQRWHADRWFQSDRLPPDVLEPFHLDQACLGTEKVRNGMFTLQKLISQSFCLAFDQFEDTYMALAEPGQQAINFSQQLGILLRNLSVMPGFNLLFSFQLSYWQLFPRVVPPMLIDRMIEGHGAQILRELNDRTAQELVQERMRVAVWSQMTDLPPFDCPCFPFTIDDVRKMRIDTGGELRGFLHRAQQEFELKLRAISLPLPPPPIRLIGVEPQEVLSHEPTPVLIRGENLPPDVRVLFAGQPSSSPSTCRPLPGEIDVTTPVGLVGDVTIRVEATDIPDNGASLVLRFITHEVPRPYNQHIDLQLLRACRDQQGLTQTQVADRINSKQKYISNLELGRWPNAPDDIFVRLAELYGKPLSSFMKR